MENVNFLIINLVYFLFMLLGLSIVNKWCGKVMYVEICYNEYFKKVWESLIN